MKWIIALLCCWTICGQLGIEDGYSTSGGLVICRNPFCSTLLTPQPACETITNVFITQPLNGSNWYWTITGAPTLNVTVTVVGGSPTYCQYKINGGLWNNFNVCGTGVNGTYSGSVTMPEGYPDTMLVNITGCNSVTNQSLYSVFYRQGEYPSGTGSAVFFIGGLLLLYTMYLGSRAYYNRKISI